MNKNNKKNNTQSQDKAPNGVNEDDNGRLRRSC